MLIFYHDVVCLSIIIYESLVINIMADEKTKGKYTDYKNKYNAENYDSLRIVVPKGKKAKIKAHAEKNGESLNGFVNRAVDEAMNKDSNG